ncbi:hypothetical protein D9M70_547320 [compost metagenome]
MLERLHVNVDRQLAIDKRSSGEVRTPEIHDVQAVFTLVRVNFQNARVLGDNHRDRPGALGAFAFRILFVAGNVRGNQQDFFVWSLAHQSAGHLQAGGRAVARLFEFDHSAVGFEAQHPVHEKPGRLGLVDTALGRQDDGRNGRFQFIGQ